MTSPKEHYRAVEAAAGAEASLLDRRVTRASMVRTVTFLIAAIALLLLETTPRELWSALIAVAAGGAVAFLWSVRRHSRLEADLRRARMRESIASEAIARMHRDWDALPPTPLEGLPDEHPCASDLDLVGHASVAHLIGRVRTAPGRVILRQLVLDPFAALPAGGPELVDRLNAPGREPLSGPRLGWNAELEGRQEAVRALAPATEFREHLELLAREVGGGGATADTRRFLRWLERPRWLPNHRTVLTLGRVLAVCTPLTLGTWFFGWTPVVVPILFALVSLGLQRKVGSALDERAGAAEAGEGDLRRWTTLLEHIESLPSDSSLLERLGGTLREPASGAARALRSLLRITDTAHTRRNALFHFPLVALFSFDIHMLDLLERWQARHGAAAGGWVVSLGEIEVLCALAGLAHDHPTWAYPTFSDEAGGGIEGRAMGHPLLDPDHRVDNDVEVPGPERLLLVTGSNMAGKTTLLRALGANQILALTGAPVTAAGFRTRPLLPWTAMRVRDSLEGGVSYFLAELNRLRRVVDAARGGPVLYLLDEILQGTNSEERRVAARIVLTHLLETGAVGAVTTHDLGLSDAEALRERGVEVHFREDVRETAEGRRLEFDYRLRPGPATSRNALLLLEMAGLGPDGS